MPDAQYPAFREELVASLLETLITHPRAEAASRATAVPDQLQDSTVVDAMQALSLQQTPPATPGEYHIHLVQLSTCYPSAYASCLQASRCIL